jgi:CRISPR-associated protein Cas1
MNPRIVEVCTNNRHLNLYRGFMRVMDSKNEVGRVAISDIGVLIINAHGVSYSNDLIVSLSMIGVPIVVTGSNHLPVSWLWPAEGNSVQAKRMDAQIACKNPLKKRLWKEIVKAKVVSQASLLDALGKPSIPLYSLVKRVKSGDTTNVEAHAAQRYWTLLFGSNFRRDRGQMGINAMLNYGYTIMRSAVARALMGVGLHPTISIFHQNKYNSFRLVDDLMEPFRALVDWHCFHLPEAYNNIELTPAVKEVFVNILFHKIQGPRGLLSVGNAINEVASSLATVYQNPNERLWLPQEYRFDSFPDAKNVRR